MVAGSRFWIKVSKGVCAVKSKAILCLLTLSHDIECVLILNNIKGGYEILLFIRGVPFFKLKDLLMFYIMYFKNQILKSVVLSPLHLQLFKVELTDSSCKAHICNTVNHRICSIESAHLSLPPLAMPLKW